MSDFAKTNSIRESALPPHLRRKMSGVMTSNSVSYRSNAASSTPTLYVADAIAKTAVSLNSTTSTVDGVSLNSQSFLLVAGQALNTENGYYKCLTSGWQKFATGSGTIFSIKSGTEYGQELYYQNAYSFETIYLKSKRGDFKSYALNTHQSRDSVLILEDAEDSYAKKSISVGALEYIINNKAALKEKEVDLRVDGLSRFKTVDNYQPLIAAGADHAIQFSTETIQSNELPYGLNRTAGKFATVVVREEGFYELSTNINIAIQDATATAMTLARIKLFKNSVQYSYRHVPMFVQIAVNTNYYHPANSLNLEDKVYCNVGDKLQVIFNYDQTGGGATFGLNSDYLDVYFNLNLVTKRSTNA